MFVSMINWEIRSLGNISIQEVYDVFMESFSDYEVSMEMSFCEFEEMLLTRDINLNYSVGCFNNEKLVGFILCGYREIKGKKYYYDGGTGVIPSFRRKGIADELLIHLINLLKQKGINIFLLEVLENNIPAIELYRKNGFIIERRFESFKINKNDIIECILTDYTVQFDKKEYVDLDDVCFQPFLPSWQNEKLSILNNIENYEYCSVSNEKQIVAFGFIHKKRGDIPQLRVVKGYENKQIELFIINKLKNRTESDVVKFVTLDQNNSLATKLPELGFGNFVNLYEMTLSLD